MKTFEISILRFADVIYTTHVSFIDERDAIRHKSGLFEGLLFAGYKPTGYSIKEIKK